MNFLRLLVCSLVAIGAARAQDIDLVGNTGWSRNGGLLRIYAERIDNIRDRGVSGYLRLQIWATTNVYDGSNDITGYIVGTYNLGGLPAGSSFLNVHRQVRYFRPPPGLYYTTITLEEYTDNGYFIVDSENFDGVVNFGGFGEGSVADLGSNGDVGFVGDISWLAGNRRVRISAEQILNERPSGRSGVLRARLWATSTPYAGGSVLQGYPMAASRAPRVSAGYYLPDYSRSVPFRAPPAGEYYVTMTLEELVRGRWSIVDYITFDGTSIF